MGYKLRYYNQDKSQKIEVVTHSWAGTIAVLNMYACRRVFFIKTWHFIRQIHIDWPENQGILIKIVNDVFNQFK